MKTASAILTAVVLATISASSHTQASAQTPAQGAAQTKGHPIPRIVERDGRYALLVDGAPYLMLSAQVHNSSSWPAELPKVWPAMEYLNVNTVEMPIYWEQIEPQQGHFDFSMVDNLLKEARAHHVHLDILWFGTWKNGSQHYTPEWMKLHPEIYMHVVNKNGQPVDSPSPLATASMEADKVAFSAFLRHLKAADPERTVIIVQVENETGTWGTLRDYSPAAQTLFDGPVPTEVLSAMHVPAATPAPTWAEAFGPEADVDFHAWAIAKYVGQVAAAGKAVYPIPMYVNAALRDPIKPGAPGSYESGGPTDNVLNIWKAEAPALDVLAPDIYMNNPDAYRKVLELYHRPDNPLFVPETGGSPRFFFDALGLQTIGFSPFGLDYTKNRNGDDAAAQQAVLTPWALNYRLIGPMDRDVARLNFEGKLKAVAEEQGEVTQTLPFGAWNATVAYGARANQKPTGNPQPTGRALVAQLGDNQFLVAGYSCSVDFRPVEAGKHRQFLKVEEGTYENGAFKFLRILNGDETDYGLNFTAFEPLVLRVSLATY
jgi:beta-galactosidase GanA